MPQMAPLLWMNLMDMFLVGYFLFYSVTYFIKFLLKPGKMESSVKTTQKDWKW